MLPWNDPVHAWSAVQVLGAMQSGGLTSEQYVQALLDRVDAVDESVQAWAWLDRDSLLAQAREADRSRRAGVSCTPLLGLPVGLKDIIDVHGVPTEHGTELHAGRLGPQDAALVRRLRNAGGLVMGKTVTTELATYAPGKTRNPLDPQRTPGGSSSGSAAAVAAGMVPLAVGTQTNGSVIRPASFCGVVGFKPSFGLIARSGVLQQSAVLDHVGVFGRNVDDAALLAHALAGPDDGDPASLLAPRPARWAGDAGVAAPLLGVARTPFWARLQPDARHAFDAWASALGHTGRDVDLPGDAGPAVDWHRTIMEADIAGSYEAEYERGQAVLSASLRGQVERGRAVSAVQYRRAVEQAGRLAQVLDALFDTFDAFATPAALGTAPPDLASTGDPLMSTLWTLAGLPAITLPLLRGADGMPLGVQLVGRRFDEPRLLRAARWLEARAARDGAGAA